MRRPALQIEQEAEEVADGDKRRSVAIGQAHIPVGENDASKLSVLSGVGDVLEEVIEVEGRHKANGALVGLLCDAITSPQEAITPASEPRRAMGQAEQETKVDGSLPRHVLQRHCPGKNSIHILSKMAKC